MCIRDSQNTVVETGTEDYILGKQTFVFTYTLRDVTKTFDNGQELYWDPNGTGSCSYTHLDGYKRQ